MTIAPGSIQDLEETFALYRRVVAGMNAAGLDQWGDAYPSKEILAADLAAGTQFHLKENSRLLAAMTLNHEEDPEYDSIVWRWPNEKRLVVHRLAVEPALQGRGLAKTMMRFAEAQAQRQGCLVVRLDTYGLNAKALQLYDSLNYARVGEVFFPTHNQPFVCFEKRTDADI